MKRLFVITLILSFAILSLGAIAQPPPPPENPVQSGANPHVGGAGAKVGSGMSLLIGMAGIYGGKKMYTIRRANKKEK